MTEAGWRTGSDFVPMLEFLRDRASQRPLRLFGVACCRCFGLETDEQLSQVLDVTERYADQKATKAALKRARQAIRAARYDLPAGTSEVRGEWAVYWLAEVTASENAFGAVGDEIHRLAGEGLLDVPGEKQALICSLLRDLFGPLPFRPIALDPAILHWNNGTVVRLAQAIYDERAFDRLPILADALEEAGCMDADILAHCRGPGPHVRGCFVLDWLLGKS